MDPRYQVFISSTFFDLAEERAAVVSALLQLDAIPAGMELFPAADDDAWTLIERVIDASDYYLLVIGGRYGSIDPVTELSFTEREFDHAVAAHKPVMAFLHEDPDAIPAGKSEKTEEAREKLSAFRNKPRTTKNLAEATELVMRAITTLLEELRNEKAPDERWDPAAKHQSETGHF